MTTRTTFLPAVAGLLLALAGCGEDPQPPVPLATAAAPPASIAAPVVPEPPVADVVMDVMRVVGRPESEVAALLGEPSSCEQVHRARWCKYPPHQDEVMFVAGKADMVTVRAMGAVAFNESALGSLGLAPAAPDQADPYAIRWQSLPGLEEVTVFPGPGGFVDYAYVKVGRH